MRLWHQSLIPYLPSRQILGQHRECCALRGKGWGRKQSSVRYVFNYSPLYLVCYHKLVMEEMHRRGYKPNQNWENPSYRGKTLGFDYSFELRDECVREGNIYPEHNDQYLKECYINLCTKNQKGKIKQGDWVNLEKGFSQFRIIEGCTV